MVVRLLPERCYNEALTILQDSKGRGHMSRSGLVRPRQLAQVYARGQHLHAILAVLFELYPVLRRSDDGGRIRFVPGEAARRAVECYFGGA